MSNKTEVWKKASEVYAELSELSPQQALARVHGIKNITLDVRNAIITLINSGSQASQFYRDEISQNFNVGLNNTQNFTVGQQLDEYELLEEIGHGGMSQVFKAKRINTETQTHVAIKVFAPKDNSKELLNHFLNEQKILAGLSHPNIVKMLHSGRTTDGVTYLVMELIEDAQPLDKFCQDNQLTINQKIYLITQCAEALSYSHANLIIHRDLKPDNILINQDKQLKIVDFGIAKLISNDLSGNKTTIMALTPSYAAPEQINSGFISIKTDIFSLAVVALDLLTTQNPLPKDRLVKSCANDEQHIDNLLKKLKIDKDLKNILNKALEQEPNKRYSSMQSFADDLNNYLQKMPVNATAQSWFYRVQKFAKRRAALFATMVSFVLFLLIGSVLGYQQYKQILTEIDKAQMMKQFMLDAFSQTNPDYSKGRVVTAEDILNFTAQKVEQVNFNNAFKFELLQTVGIAYGALGNYTKATEFLDKSLQINPNNSKSLSYLAKYLYASEQIKKLTKVLSNVNIEKFPNSPDKARIYRAKSGLYMKNSKFKESELYLKRALNLESDAKNNTGVLITNKQIAQLYYEQSKPNDAIIVLNELLSNASLEYDNTSLIGIRNDLILYYIKIGEFQKALDEHQKIIGSLRTILGSESPELADSLVRLTDIYFKMSDFKNAKKSIDEAYTIFKKLYGEKNPNTARALNSLAIYAFMKGDLDTTIELLYQVVEIFENEYTSGGLETLHAKTNLAGALTAAKKPQEAETILVQVYNSQIQSLGKKHLSTLFTQQHLVNTLSALNKHDEAILMATENVSTLEENFGIENPASKSSYAVLARSYQKAKLHDKALKTFLFIEKENLFERDDPQYPIVLKAIAKEYNKLANISKADEYYRKSIDAYKIAFSNSSTKTINLMIEYLEFLKANGKKNQVNELMQKIEKIIEVEKIDNANINDKINDFRSSLR